MKSIQFINMNHQVTVQLNDSGAKDYNEHIKNVNLMLLAAGSKLQEDMKTKGDILNMPLWEMCEIFGSQMQMSEVLFKDNLLGIIHN